jgi:hypothetical protein
MILAWQDVGTDKAKDRWRFARTKVPGGWLVRGEVWDYQFDDPPAGAVLTFLPDPDHKWDGNSLP